MLKVNFPNKTDLWNLNRFSIANNIDIYTLLDQAYIKEALVTEEI